MSLIVPYHQKSAVYAVLPGRCVPGNPGESPQNRQRGVSNELFRYERPMATNWRPGDLRQSFEASAKDAELYLPQIEGRRRNPGAGDEMLRAEHEAKFHLYNYLAGSAAVESRETFVAELERLLKRIPEPPLPSIARDSFKNWYEHYVRALLARQLGERA